jgi:hypothetical protein
MLDLTIPAFGMRRLRPGNSVPPPLAVLKCGPLWTRSAIED